MLKCCKWARFETFLSCHRQLNFLPLLLVSWKTVYFGKTLKFQRTEQPWLHHNGVLNCCYVNLQHYDNNKRNK